MSVERALLAVVLLLVALNAGLALFWEPSVAFPADQPLVSALPAGGDFVLDNGGQPVSPRDYRGKVVVLYFGYSYCPDICPTALQALAEGLRQLRPEELARVQGLFVSVDPERDTPAQLAAYTGFFHPSILGATGTPAQVRDAAGRYDVVFRKVAGENPATYSIDHSSLLYLIAADGHLAQTLPHGVAGGVIADAVRQLLPQPPTGESK